VALHLITKIPEIENLLIWSNHLMSNIICKYFVLQAGTKKWVNDIALAQLKWLITQSSNIWSMLDATLRWLLAQ